MPAPDPSITPAQLERGLKLGVVEGAFAFATFTLTSGAVLAAFVYSSGMGAFQYGLFTALPFLAQLLQIPNVALLRRWHDRRRMTVLFASAGRLSLLGVTAALLFLLPVDWRQRRGPQAQVGWIGRETHIAAPLV